MSFRWLHIFFLLLPSLLNAQVFSSKGRFSVEFDRGCAPMTVNITEHDSFGTTTRVYHYFEGQDPPISSKTFSYQDPGVYQIVQIVGVDGIDDRSDTLFVEVLDPIKPEVEYSKCNGFGLSVISQDNYYDSIRVYFTADDSVTLLEDEVASFVFLNGNTQIIELKGFFANADEICTSFFDEVLPLSSLSVPEILNASVKESCRDVYSLYMEVDEIDTLINYRVNLSQSSDSRIFDGHLSGTSLTLIDIPFDRNENFCVKIEAYDPCDDSSTVGPDFCGETSQLSLSPFASLYSTYDSAGIYINLDQVNLGTFEVYRKLEDGEFEFRTNEDGSFTDPIGSNGRRYSYQIHYVDSCGESLYSATTNPPLVETLQEGTNQYFVTFTSPVNSLAEVPTNEYQSGTSFSQTSMEISQPEFSIQLNSKDGSPLQYISTTSSYPTNDLVLQSNAKPVRFELVIYVPNAFTPNDDGLNDTLELFGLPTETATTNIYNRWGKLIYTSDQPSPGWDGTFNGARADEGTYLYEIIFETASGEKRRQKGTFALIRK